MDIFYKKPPEVAVSRDEFAEALTMLRDALRRVLDTLALASKHAAPEKVEQNLRATTLVEGVVSVVSAPVIAADVDATKPVHKI